MFLLTLIAASNCENADEFTRQSTETMTELYKKHFISLFNICKTKGLTRADSEDVVSEAYYRFWCKFNELKDLNPIQQRAWLYRATENIFHEKLREAIPVTQKNFSEYEETLPDKNDEINKFLENDAFETLVKELEAKLTDSEKTAFHVLLDIDSGLSYKEISEMRNINVSTLTSMTARLRKRIQEILNEDIGNK